MKKYILLAFLFSNLTTALWADCPIPVGTANRVGAIKDAIAKAKTCYESSQIAEACSYGDSLDVGITEVAADLCAKDYQSITEKDKVILGTLEAKCSDKYAEQRGTMYRSFSAFCRLNVIKLFSELYLPVVE